MITERLTHGEKFLLLLRKSQKSKKEIAEALDVLPQYLSRYYEREHFSKSLIQRICTALDVDTREFNDDNELTLPRPSEQKKLDGNTLNSIQLPLGARLTQYIEKKGHTIYSFAKVIGINRQTLDGIIARNDLKYSYMQQILSCFPDSISIFFPIETNGSNIYGNQKEGGITATQILTGDLKDKLGEDKEDGLQGERAEKTEYEKYIDDLEYEIKALRDKNQKNQKRIYALLDKLLGEDEDSAEQIE